MSPNGATPARILAALEAIKQMLAAEPDAHFLHRLWVAGGRDDHLYTALVTSIAASNPEGWVGAEYLDAAIARAASEIGREP